MLSRITAKPYAVLAILYARWEAMQHVRVLPYCASQQHYGLQLQPNQNFLAFMLAEMGDLDPASRYPQAAGRQVLLCGETDERERLWIYFLREVDRNFPPEQLRAARAACLVGENYTQAASLVMHYLAAETVFAGDLLPRIDDQGWVHVNQDSKYVSLDPSALPPGEHPEDDSQTIQELITELLRDGYTKLRIRRHEDGFRLRVRSRLTGGDWQSYDGEDLAELLRLANEPPF